MRTHPTHSGASCTDDSTCRCAAPVVLVVAYDQPRLCEFGIEVSERSPDGYAVTLCIVEQLRALLVRPGVGSPATAPAA